MDRLNAEFPPAELGLIVAFEQLAALARPLESLPTVTLGHHEEALLAGIGSDARRREWMAGRGVGKELLKGRYGLDPAKTEILPDPQGAPNVVAQARAPALHFSLSHSRRYAAAACGEVPVGVDLCDLADASRIKHVRARVFETGEAERVDAFKSPERCAAVWALKEACLKASGGGVFAPGPRSVRLLSLVPPLVADSAFRVRLYRLPEAILALAYIASDKRG